MFFMNLIICSITIFLARADSKLEEAPKHLENGGAINLLEGKVYPHHPVMLQTPIVTYKLLPRHLVEWGGLYVPVHYDCGQTFAHKEVNLPHDYFCEVPTRWLTCWTHLANMKSHIGMETPLPPLVDDEYHELTAVYQSVLRSKPYDTYVVAELGARWGTWGYRSLQFLRNVRPNQKYNLYLVEPSPTSCEAIRHMQKINNFDSSSIHLDCALANKNNFVSWANSVSHIDLVDLDIQGGEKSLVPQLMDIFNDKVYRLIIGTHSPAIHAEMKALFKKQNWITIWNVEHQHDMTCIRTYLRCANQTERFKWDKLLEKGCYHDTPRGPVAHSDGELIVDNPKFVSRERVFSISDTILKVNDLL